MFAMITMDERTVERVVRWSMTILEKSPIYREIWQKGHNEGIEEGVESLIICGTADQLTLVSSFIIDPPIL